MPIRDDSLPFFLTFPSDLFLLSELAFLRVRWLVLWLLEFWTLESLYDLATLEDRWLFSSISFSLSLLTESSWVNVLLLSLPFTVSLCLRSEVTAIFRSSSSSKTSLPAPAASFLNSSVKIWIITIIIYFYIKKILTFFYRIVNVTVCFNFDGNFFHIFYRCWKIYEQYDIKKNPIKFYFQIY